MKYYTEITTTKVKFTMKSLTIYSLLICCLVAQTSQASLMTFEQDVDFHAPTQSIWSADGSVSGINEGDRFGGSLGFEYQLQSSTGGVNADFNGVLAIDYNDRISNGYNTNLDFTFVGDAQGNTLSTQLGANFSFGWFVDTHLLGIPVKGSGDLISLGYSLSTFANDMAELPTLFTIPIPFGGTIEIPFPHVISDSDQLDLAGLGVDLSVIDVGAAVTLEQITSFWANGISGLLMGKHRNTGMLTSTLFAFDSKDTHSFNIDLPLNGYWDLYFDDLYLKNMFMNDFDLMLNAYIEIDVGIADKTWRFNFADQNIYSNNFPLDFDANYLPKSFSILVVSEPKSMPLFALTLILFVSLQINMHRKQKLSI